MQELDARRPDVEATAIGRWTEELRRLNGELHTLITARYSEEAKRSQLQMRKVRTEIDAVYGEILYLLEAAAALGDSNAYKELFNELNARITRYANILAQEKGRRKEKTDERINGKTDERINGQTNHNESQCITTESQCITTYNHI
jgi:polyphosphate kinase 2 (PPK2 family)